MHEIYEDLDLNFYMSFIFQGLFCSL